MLVDPSFEALRPAATEGLTTSRVEILSAVGEHMVDMRDLEYLYAATDDDAYNALVCTRFAGEMGRERVHQPPPAAEREQLQTSREWRGKYAPHASLTPRAPQRAGGAGLRVHRAHGRGSARWMAARLSAGPVLAVTPTGVLSFRSPRRRVRTPERARSRRRSGSSEFNTRRRVGGHGGSDVQQRQLEATQRPRLNGLAFSSCCPSWRRSAGAGQRASQVLSKRCSQATCAQGSRSSMRSVGVAVDEAGQHVGDVGLGLDVVQLAGLDQRSDHGPVLAAAVGAGEQAVLAVQRQGPDGALDGVGVELDASVVQEARQTLPAPRA